MARRADQVLTSTRTAEHDFQRLTRHSGPGLRGTKLDHDLHDVCFDVSEIPDSKRAVRREVLEFKRIIRLGVQEPWNGSTVVDRHMMNSTPALLPIVCGGPSTRVFGNASNSHPSSPPSYRPFHRSPAPPTSAEEKKQMSWNGSTLPHSASTRWSQSAFPRPQAPPTSTTQKKAPTGRVGLQARFLRERDAARLAAEKEFQLKNAAKDAAASRRPLTLSRVAVEGWSGADMPYIPPPPRDDEEV